VTSVIPFGSCRNHGVRIAVVGTGGVGSAFARIVQRRDFYEHCALADYDGARPERLVASLDDARFSAHAVDASAPAGVLGEAGVVE